MRRLWIVVAAVVVTIALSATSAFAFECYNTKRSANGNAAAAGSQALWSFERILSSPEVVGLCPDGVDYVIDGLDELGYRTDVLINFRALMASGLERSGNGAVLLHDGKGIDHLSEQFFADVDALIFTAFTTICS